MRLTMLFGGPHTSQPSFRRAGVSVGDFVYPITVYRGAIYVIARLHVHAIQTLEAYIEHHPKLFAPYKRSDWAMETLGGYLSARPLLRYLSHTCTDEVITGEGTLLHFDRPLPSVMLQRLRYRSKRGDRPLKHVENGRLKRSIGLQGIYRLSPESARDFEQVVASSETHHRSKEVACQEAAGQQGAAPDTCERGENW